MYKWYHSLSVPLSTERYPKRRAQVVCTDSYPSPSILLFWRRRKRTFRTRTQKTEKSSCPGALLLSLGLAGATAVGSTALVKGNEDYKRLSKQTDIDLSTLEDTVGKLKTSLSSLAEVVLQNRRRLDLLFLKQGGLCLALGETCCFYTNHLGVIRESLSQLHRRLQEREEERARQGN